MASAMRTWLITGCSTGLGRSLAEVLIQKGERVLATARHPASLSALVDGHDNAHAMKLDVTSADDIAAVVAYADAELGGVDVLVNNAGYGYIASVEEADEAEYRALFETNLFGLIEVTRAVLPGLRAKGRGHVLNISSVGGMMGNIGSAYYAGTKFALVGLSEALAKEVEGLGIKVTVIAPGPFRTDWAGRSLKTAPKRIDAYADTVHKRIDGMAQTSGAQAGDPVRAAEAMIAVVDSAHPPVHLILGESGLTRVREHLTALTKEIDDWADVSIGADFPR
jgi:NAD(P)-dependent dehydrogenase (short-subunit alcohol dehydrogenase family)